MQHLRVRRCAPQVARDLESRHPIAAGELLIGKSTATLAVDRQRRVFRDRADLVEESPGGTTVGRASHVDAPTGAA